MSGPIRKLIILKTGGSPVNETWYIQQVLDSVGLPFSTLSGADITIRDVASSNLNQTYVVGLVTGLGISVDRCSLTPFSDADGGRGMLVKVYG